MQSMYKHDSANNAWQAEKFMKALFTERAVYAVVRVGGNWQQLKDGIARVRETNNMFMKDDLTDSQIMPNYSVYAWNTCVSNDVGLLYTSCEGVYEVQIYANDTATVRKVLKELKAETGFEMRKKTYA